MLRYSTTILFIKLWAQQMQLYKQQSSHQVVKNSEEKSIQQASLNSS
jgi:hypothetical protein